MILPREAIYVALWARVSAATVSATDPARAAPIAPGPYTLRPVRTWVSDLGVVYAAGGALTKVPGAPAVGQYAVSAGVYTFNAADASAKVVISYVTPAFVTTNRRLRHWNDVPAQQQPALFMIEHREVVHQVKGLPPTWTFSPELFVYDNCGSDPDSIPGQRINYLLDAIDNALAPAGGSGGYQTLGGLVSHCWIAGPIDIYEGYKDMMDQSVAIIPVEIRVPDDSGPV